MTTIAITAPTGMLGSMVYKTLKDRYNLVLVYHQQEKLAALDAVYGGTSRHRLVPFDLMDISKDYLEGFHGSIGPCLERFINAIGPVDAVIQCAGITNRYSTADPLKTFFLNSALPNLLGAVYKEKLFHITTDCVFDGVVGAPYNEQSLKQPRDLYGLTKLLGEPSQHSLVLRTSFIGPEVNDFVGLISWFLHQSGKTINGFTNHYWNGITTRELGRIIDAIIANRSAFPGAGLYHLFSNDISKYDMLVAFQRKYQIDVNIIPIESQGVDRRLSSVYGLCKQFQIPRFEQMLAVL